MRTSLLFTWFTFALIGCSANVGVEDPESLTTIEFHFVVAASDPNVDGQCMPKLTTQNDCSAQCEVLVVFPEQTDQAAGCTDPGMSQPDSATLARFVAQVPNTQATPVVCAYSQLVGGNGSSVALATGCQNSNAGYLGATCTDDPTVSGWCVADGNAVNDGCERAIQFAGSGPPIGALVSFQCIERSM